VCGRTSKEFTSHKGVVKLTEKEEMDGTNMGWSIFGNAVLRDAVGAFPATNALFVVEAVVTKVIKGMGVRVEGRKRWHHRCWRRRSLR